MLVENIKGADKTGANGQKTFPHNEAHMMGVTVKIYASVSTQ